MTIRTIECGECGTPVPSGRLACPSCGALLAAVAGAPPPPIRVIETPSPVADASEAPRKGSKAKKAAASSGAAAGVAVADGTGQPATKRATQAVSRAATAAGRAATAATAKAKTTAAAATAAVTPAKPSGNDSTPSSSAGGPAPTPTVGAAATPRSPGKVAAAIALAVAATPTTAEQGPSPGAVIAPKASGGSRPYPVPTAAPAAAPLPAAATGTATVDGASRSSRVAAMPAAVAAPPTASARPFPVEEPPAPPPAGHESRTGSAPAQLAYLIDPVANDRSRARAPELATNGTSAYLLDPDPLDGAVGIPDESPWPPPEPEPALVGRPYVRGSVTAGGAAAMPPRPGAYLPPNSVLPPSSVSRPSAIGTASTAAAFSGSAPATATPVGAATSAPIAAAATAAVPAAAVPAAVVGSPGPTAAGVPARIPGATPPDAGGGDTQPSSGGQPSTLREAFASVGAAVTSVVDRIDRDRVTEVAGWFVIAGSAMSVLGFLLPWSVVVIGAGGTGGYLDDWGLASPTHLFVVIALLGLLALSVLENPVPAWLRTGVFGLVLGALVFGLTWPYTIGPLGAQLGAMLTFFGSIALLTGGAIASWSSRHARIDPGV